MVCSSKEICVEERSKYRRASADNMSVFADIRNCTKRDPHRWFCAQWRFANENWSMDSRSGAAPCDTAAIGQFA